MKWNVKQNELSKSTIQYSYFDQQSNPLTFESAIELWANDFADSQEFRQFHSNVLKQIPFVAFKWETPIIDLKRVKRPFEFVALSSPGLDRKQNQSAFKNQFSSRQNDRTRVLTFENLGRNALLVVPTPGSKVVNHCHLASFHKTASTKVCAELWRHVGLAMKQRVSDKPVWLSTAGGGVPWLHVRLDDRPKYYRYEPYRSE